MKKLIITSVCTLGLTLLGAFGNNLAYGASQCTTNVEQLLINIQNSLPDDNKALAATIAEVKKDTSNNTVKSTANKSNKVKAKNKKSSKPNMVYKGVNLSGCDNAKEVVKELKKNGITGITTGNIKNDKALSDILKNISKNNNTPTPTKAPTPTAKPVPTSTPAPTKTPTPTAQPTNPSDISGYADQVLKIMNQERAKAGLPALTTNKTLTSAANKRAQEIVQSFSHTRPDGSSFYSVLKDYGISYSTCGENIAYGQKSPQEVMTGWMNSPGHRANILKSGYGKVGIGVYKVNGVIYWTQEFTN